MTDRISPNSVALQAAHDFNKARNKAIFSRIQHFMNVDRDRLLSLNDVKEILKPKNEVYRGMRTVPIKLILGSEGRYRDFNKYFLPTSEFLRARWERVDRASIKDIPLPPIQLYEIGGAYFVRDGNHRVSVARLNGGEMIDAEVTSLSTEIAIEPSMTTDERTKFGAFTGDYELNFTMPGCYDVIYNHILVHKYYLNQGKTEEIPFEEALVSWYGNVYFPIIKIIRDEWLSLDFPGRSPGDLYIWIVKHWDFLKKKYGVDYSVSDAVKDFSVKYGGFRGRILRFFGFILGGPAGWFKRKKR